jgi:hypothetical protein
MKTPACLSPKNAEESGYRALLKVRGHPMGDVVQLLVCAIVAISLMLVFNGNGYA